MDESEENLSADDINNTKSPVVKSKPKKRSLVERELETNLTARVISPISPGDGCSTSRYGRARQQKNENSESEKAAKMLKSPKTEISQKLIQSPVYKMHASNSPIKSDSQKPEPFECQIENIYSENNSLSRFGSAKMKISPSKRYPKVYIRKDLIQLKDKDKEAEETVVLIKNMFSPVKSAQKSSLPSLERSLEKSGKRKLTSKDTQSVVKTLDFDEKHIKKENDKNKKDTGKMGLSKNETFEIEAKSEYQVGDLAWARMGTYPFWPCIITREPGSGLFVKTKLFGRTVRNMLNVTFFGDNGRRSWIADSMLRPFLGQLEFETTRAHFTSEAKKKDPKLYTAFFISERKMPQWLLSVEEAETLLREPKRLRIDILSSMLMKVRPEKVTPRSEKGKRVTRTDSDVSLSESLYDTLFSEDDTKGNDSDRRNKGKQSLDVSEVVTACLDNMAAKTGITKIQKQSHMDRWLLKAKTKTPEKSQAVQKAIKSSAKTLKPKIPLKPYRFRSRHNESQSSDSSILNDHSEASVSVSYDDVLIENSNDRLHNESNLTDIVSDNISETNDSDKKLLDSDNSVFKSPLSETEKKVIKERKKVLNKIKQSIDSDENMPSSSSVDISGMSTSFEISRVDAQSSDKEIVDSDVNENVSEITDGEISHRNINIYDIDKCGPITSSPKNSIADIEISTEVLNNSHEKEHDISVQKISTSDKLKQNECINIESDCKNNDCTKNVANDNISDLNIEKMQENTFMDTIIDESKKSGIEKENESIVDKKPDVKLDKNIDICKGVHEEGIENNSNFRRDRKIKTRQKTAQTLSTELIESKGSCKDKKSNVCELNTPNTRFKKIRTSNVNIDLDLDKSKLKKIDQYNKINQETPITLVSQNKSNEYNEMNSNEYCQGFDRSNNILHKSSMDIVANNESKIEREQEIKEIYKGLLLENKQNKQKEVNNEGTLNSKDYECSESIHRNGTIISETKLKQNDCNTSSKYALRVAKCEVSASIDNSAGKDNSQKDLKPAYNNAAFQKYLELRQDNVLDEHPELSKEEIISYLYKTWQYETKYIIDNKVTGESNKTPAKGTNYKALDKERGRKKLVRKKSIDFTQNGISPPINKSPVNGYHKEIKPIIVSPKNKIIFLPRKSMNDSVINNLNDFKFCNTPLSAEVQTPRMENKVNVSSVGINNTTITETITDTKTESSELPSETNVENANSNRNNTNMPENENKLSISQNITVLKNDSDVGQKSIFVSQSHSIQKSEKIPGITAVDNNKKLSPTENKVNVSQNEPENVTSTKLGTFEPKTNNTVTNDQKLTHETVLKNDSNAGEKSIFVSQSYKIQKSEKFPGITAVDNNKNLSPTENKVNVSQNGPENVTSTKPDAFEPKTNNTVTNDQKLTHDHNGRTIESNVTKVPASNSVTKTMQTLQNVLMSTKNCNLSQTVSRTSKNIKEKEPNIVNNIEDTKYFEKKTLSSEENKFKETEVLSNDSFTKTKQRKLKITLTRSNLLEKCVKACSSLSETEKPSTKAPNNILPNGNEDGLSLNKTNNAKFENECLVKTCIAPGEENVKPLITSVHRKAIEITQLNKDFECKENTITEKVSFTHEKICVDNSIEYDKKYSESGEDENVVKPSFKDRNETVPSNLRNSESECLLANTTTLNVDTEEQNITLEKTIASFCNKIIKTSMENNETASVTQDGLTKIINKNCSISSKQYIENVDRENPEFQKYLELKQDSVVDEHPELSHDQVIQYLYKTWLYEEINKSERKITDEVDQINLVKDVSTIKVDRDKKRKKLSRKKPSNSTDIKKKQPTIINHFFKHNGFQEQFEKSLNTKTEFQAMESRSEIESEQGSKVTVSDCKSHDTNVKNIDKERNTIGSSVSSTVIQNENVNDQNFNESTEYEPQENNDEKFKSKDIENDSDHFDSASCSSTDCEIKMTLSARKKKRKQKGTQEENKKAMMEPEFIRYLELRQDSVIDEHPELSHEEVIQYLYKTWLYEENNKSEKKISDEVDQTSLVKGVSSIHADKIRKKLSRKRSTDTSDAKKKLPTIINKFLMQNGYHEYHEKSLDNDDKEISTLNTQSHHQNVDEKVPETDNDDKSLSEEIIRADKFDSASTSSDSEFEKSLSDKRRIWKEKQKLKKRTQAEKEKALMDAEFVRYLELRQDYVMDEHPELTEEEITNYLYKTWLYEENIKNDKKRDDEVDQTSLVKGVDLESKKPKRKHKIVKEDSQESFKVSEVFEVEPKEKSKRSTARPYYNEEISDIEEELALFEIFRKKKPNTPNVEQQVIASQPTQVGLTHNTEEISNIEDYVYDETDMVEIYFEQLTTPKPNVFKGLVRERVCEICEKISNLVKCKTCHGMFHTDCVKNQYKTQIDEKSPSRGRKKKKKYQRRNKNSDETFMDNDGHSDEKTQDGNSDPNLSIGAEREPIVADAEDFEAKASAKMREILGDLDNIQYDYDSTNVAISWNARPGKCQIVDVKLETKRPEEVTDASNFKCNDCEKFDTPKCFVCQSPVSPKECVEYRQKCQVAHCYKYYHLECLAHWPQTQFNGGDVRNKSKEGFEAMSCPRHVCHTCVSDDPRGCKTRFSGDKLARCVRCPATYHSFTKCLPAGSQILTGSLIICPRHYEHRPGKVPCHVNTGWCFICALGGTLICCEYCPTSFHAECLNIDPPEGGYMCEDCETGRLPLYGEMVWVKLGHYRWWPGIILHPSQIPANIMAVKHSQGEFVVRFFGQYDHYWVNRGRVFPFQEGDTGKISSQKSKIDSAFTLAVEHASRACEILKNAKPNDEESQDIASSLLPPHYVKLKVNKPVGSLVNRRIDIEESSLTQCECDANDVEPCGPYSQCLNRMLLTECGPTCRTGERCNNRAFEKRQYPKMAPYRTPHRGWGLRCLEDIKAGQFVIEYVGELLDEAEFQRRMRRKHEIRDENFYFLTLDKERMIDAGPKGNLARFMNHSCEPNCETQKWTVLGDIRVGLFAIDDIPANSELTFNYNLESAGIEKKQCMCGAKRCSGYIGAKPKQGDPPKKNKIVKKTQKKTKKTESPQQKRPRGRPSKPKELTEIEKDLLIIKNATNVSEKDIISVKNSSVCSDSEFSEHCSVDSKEGKGVKRKRSSQESLTLCLKRVKTQEGDEFRID